VTTGVTVTTTPIPDPGDLLARLAADRPVAWVRRGDGLVGWGEAARLEVGAGTGRFGRANAAFARWCDGARIEDPLQLPGSGPVAYASLTFDRDAEGSVVTIPRVVLGRRDRQAWLTVVSDADHPRSTELPPVLPLPPPTRVRYAGASVGEVEWLEAVAVAARTVAAGELEKVVLARDLKVWAAEPLDTRTVARRLAERFDDCWTFLSHGLVGATPELLVRRVGRDMTSLVLAGSAPRGATAAEDARLGEALAASEKDRVEHEVAVASVLDRLREVTDVVEADARPWLLGLANVQHLATRVRAQARGGETALELAGLLHPTAAVCGTPTKVALDHIASAEGMERGRYAGPVGWMDVRGDGELGIALRCAELDGTRGRLFSGAGIVAESLPEAELEETRLKLRAMQSALEGTAP